MITTTQKICRETDYKIRPTEVLSRPPREEEERQNINYFWQPRLGTREKWMVLIQELEEGRMRKLVRVVCL